MRWRVMIELTSGDGAVHAREVAAGSDDSAGSAVKPLGLTLADAKALLAAIQRHLVQAEVADYCRERRGCPRCQEQRPIKGRQDPAVELAVRDSRSARASVHTLPLQHYMADRCTAEYERIVAKSGAWMPYRRARDLLAEFSRSVTTCPRWRRSDNEQSKSALGWNEKRCRRRSVRRRRNQRRR
jgi:hypothetical protein